MPIDKEVRDKYPSNANSKKEEVKEEKKVEKVVRGTVSKRKKPLGKRMTETFIGEDINTVSSYLVNEVLIPAAKSTIFDMVQGGFEMLLFGERRAASRSGGKRDNRSYVSYNNYSNRRDDRRDISQRDRARHNFDDIILDSRGEAEEVLNHLVDLIIDYGEATVADLYDLVGITGNFTDQKYGWTDLRSANVRAVRGGYLLNLPRTVLL